MDLQLDKTFLKNNLHMLYVKIIYIVCVCVYIYYQISRLMQLPCRIGPTDRPTENKRAPKDPCTQGRWLYDKYGFAEWLENSRLFKNSC